MYKEKEFDYYLKGILNGSYDVSPEDYSDDFQLSELDSLDILELLVTIENEFDIVFPYSDADDLKTVGALKEKVKFLIESK